MLLCLGCMKPLRKVQLMLQELGSCMSGLTQFIPVMRALSKSQRCIHQICHVAAASSHFV